MVRDVAVVGDGVAAWTVAAAIARHLRGARVAVVPVADPAPSLLDRIGIAAPGALDFHARLGLDEGDVMRRTRAGYRLGSMLRGWAAGGVDIFHGYGGHGASHTGVPFHQIWMQARSPDPFHRFSVAGEAALTGRFGHPRSDAAALGSYGYGLHYDPAAYAALIRQVAVAAGAIGTLTCTGVEHGGERVALRLASGAVVRPHLVVDATADGRIAATLDNARVDWRDWLPCDRLYSAERADAEPPPPHDQVVACPVGWHLSIPRPGTRTHGLAWSSAHASEGRAARTFRNAAGCDPAGPALAIGAGRRRHAWTGNVVAVGEAAVVTGAAEGMALHLLHAHCDRLLAMLPDRDFAAVELAEYNRQVAQEADRVRDFLHLRYHLAARSDPFWRDAARVAPPDTLAYDLKLFRERGRLPVHDEETFDRDSWLAMLIGLGVRPRRTDALAAAVDPALAARLLGRLRSDVVSAARALPAHGEYLAGVYQTSRVP